MITVYPSATTIFDNNGLKTLKPIKAKVRKEDNGDYFVDITDTLENNEYYIGGSIVRVPTPWGPQAFRLGEPQRTASRVTVRARHVYFDAENYLIDDSYVVDKGANDALDHLSAATDRPSPFSFTSDVASVASYRCVRTSLEGAIATVVERWGGHLVRDNFDIALNLNTGQNRGVTLDYGKNIKDLKITEDWDLVATKILPVGKDGLQVPETYLENNVDDYDIPYSKVVKFDQGSIDQQDFKNEDGSDDVDAYQAALLADLYAQANAYLLQNHTPRVNYALSAYLKNVSDVGDVISVSHPRIKIDLTTNVIAIEYDAIRETITKVEFGNFRQGLTTLIDQVTAAASKDAQVQVETSQAKMQLNLEEATAAIRAQMGDSFVIYDGDKILVVDRLPKEDAVNVIMIGAGGIGFSNTGINGTFSSAWTIGNELNMENINVINLTADLIRGGTLKLGQNLNQRGIIEIYDGTNAMTGLIDNEGITLYQANGGSVKLNAVDGLAGYDATNQKIYWADGSEFHMKKAVAEDEITIGARLRIIPIDTGSNTGIGFVTLVG